MSLRRCKIGLLGCGTVGQGLVELVNRNRDLIRQRSGVELSFSQILVRDLNKVRHGVDPALLTTLPDKVINNGCDLVVELVGGLEPARSYIRRALSNRKHVVTANKALLACDGFSLLREAANQRVRFGFEASVCAGIPIVRALESGLVGNSIQSIIGILNGTSNYILTRMSEAGVEFAEALEEAQAKGFAETDPTLDVDGVDAAQKLKILSELAFGGSIALDAIAVEGIRQITADDVETARKMGYVIKHVAVANCKEGVVSLRVNPVLLPNTHQLASVRHENNAVLVQADAVGEMLFHGKGAGSLPSASAVLSDIVEIAAYKRALPRVFNRRIGTSAPNLRCPRYLRFPVAETSAIGTITAMLERNGIGVTRAAAKWAKRFSDQNQVGIFTEPCTESQLEPALQQVQALGVLKGTMVALRVAA